MTADPRAYYGAVAARTQLLAARILEDLPAEPDHVIDERRAVLDAAVSRRHPRPEVRVPEPERHPGDEDVRTRLRRLMPGRAP